MKEKEFFRAMMQWLVSHMRYEIACMGKGRYQVALFGTGTTASVYYEQAHTLAQKYDKNADALMVKVESAQQGLDDAKRELYEYIKIRGLQ